MGLLGLLEGRVDMEAGRQGSFRSYFSLPLHTAAPLHVTFVLENQLSLHCEQPRYFSGAAEHRGWAVASGSWY